MLQVQNMLAYAVEHDDLRTPILNSRNIQLSITYQTHECEFIKCTALYV